LDLPWYIIMYNLYGKFIGQKTYKLSQTATVPSVELEDGMDYVPTKKEAIFGHHFTSIAGTEPIVGPAIAIIWGWVPARIWVDQLENCEWKFIDVLSVAETRRILTPCHHGHAGDLLLSLFLKKQSATIDSFLI